ncbi:MAG: OmpA family protein, partial [Bacteroidota bacterium]
FGSIMKVLKTTDLPAELKETYVVKLPLSPVEEEEKIIKDVIIVKNNNINTQVFAVGNQPEEFDGGLEELKDNFTNDNIEIGKIYEYRNIYYDFDKYNIREDASKELDHVVGLLKQYPEMKIELSSHTDIRGTNAYNDVLAKNRAKSARAYLIKNGIALDRISVDSYGEKSLFVDCGGNCDEVKHQSNRRTEIRIISGDQD